MSSIQELTDEIIGIKEKTEELASAVGSANLDLASQSAGISNIVRGSRTGEEAVMALSDATRSLSDVITSMRLLAESCDSCASQLLK